MTIHRVGSLLVSLGIILGSGGWIYGQSGGTDSALLTVAEKSNFQATSSHAEVLELCQALAKASPRVKYTEFGSTVEGRKLPLLIVADPPLSTPEEIQKSGKTVVFVFANIHAGEVDGKEGVLILARELAMAKESPLFKNVVWLLAPDYNADGNDRFSLDNRRGQNGPSKGMGIRENANGLDLNRDFVKLDSPEARALVKAIDLYNPHIIVDCHTTNGSYHRHTITYDTNKHPACDSRLLAFANDKMMPEVSSRLEKMGNWKSFYYGNFNRDKTEWVTYGHQPRFSTQYFALRNRLGILSESYSYASYKDRVMASKDFVHSILDYAAAHSAEINALLGMIEREVAGGTENQRVTLIARITAMPGRYTIYGFEEKVENGRRVRTEVPKEYAVTYIGNVEPTYTVARPTAYFVPREYTKAIGNLQHHGIHVDVLKEDIEFPVEVYQVTNVIRASNTYQNHQLVRVEAELRKESRRIPAGTYVVKTNQRLGTLASYLLEPKSEDGLVTWNFFDEGLGEGKDFPVVRLGKAQELMTTPAEVVK